MFTLDRKVDVGNLLTAITLVVSLVGATIAWNKDRQLRVQEQANRVRLSAAKLLSKFDRLRAISDSQFEEAKPPFVETKMMLRKHFDITQARDHLWGRLHEVNVLNKRRQLDEQLEVAYSELYSYDPSIRDLFLRTSRELSRIHDEAFYCLLMTSQGHVNSWMGKQKTYTTATLWTQLVNSSTKCRVDYNKNFESSLASVVRTFNHIIDAQDQELLGKAPLNKVCSAALLRTAATKSREVSSKGNREGNSAPRVPNRYERSET